MLVRVKIGTDTPGINALLRRIFSHDAETQLVHDLREDELITPGVVAADDEGQVIGYVAFSLVAVEGEELQWVGLTPLAVNEHYRGQGIGRQLVYEGLDSLSGFGYATVVTLDDPDLYRHFGFGPAARFDLHCRWPNSAETFQVHHLTNDALEDIHGQVEYSDHFNRLRASPTEYRKHPLRQRDALFRASLAA